MTATTHRTTVALRDAVAGEGRAAEQLTHTLGEVRRCVEVRDAEGLDAAVERCRTAADALARAGGERVRQTAALAGVLNLEGAATLDTVAALGDPDLADSATVLREQLQRAARKSAALGIGVRYGAASCDRVLELQRAVLGVHAGYGANGRLGGAMQRLGRHA